MSENPRKPGRPKGAKDKVKRRVIRHIVNHAITATEGRGVDKIGILRSAQANLVTLIMKEIGIGGDHAIARRRSVLDVFALFHQAEIDSIKIAPHGARDITEPTPPPIKQIEGANGSGVIQLEEFRIRGD